MKFLKKEASDDVSYIIPQGNHNTGDADIKHYNDVRYIVP